MREPELTSMLSEYISLEIDLEILDMLKATTLTTEYWSVTLGEEYDGSSWIGGTNFRCLILRTLGSRL